MKKNILIIILSSSFLFACSSKSSSIRDIAFDSSLINKNSLNARTPVQTQTIVNDNFASNIQNPLTAVKLPAASIPVTSGPVTSTAPGMNPPHGQPGHLCEIAVGAPLSSAAKTPVSTGQISKTVSTTPANTATAASTNKVITAPGMNPPHGEPGHRCEIAVGAPLSSAPKTPASTGQISKTVSPVLTPTLASSAAASTVTAPGMNPPHGQPGHDCAIAVGAPLKKK